MKMRFIIFCSAPSIAWGVSVWGQEADFVSPLVDFFEAGVVCAQDSGTIRDAPDTVAGTTHVVEAAPPFVSQGRVVPAVLGIGFGARSGLASDVGIDGVTITVTHPPFTGSGATKQSFQTYIGPHDAPGITFYQFDYDYELVTGDWVMRASSGGVTLYEMTFTVVPPTAMPQLADACGYLDLLS